MGIDYSIIDRHFGDLTVIDLDHVDTNKATYWRCRCTCGNETVVRRDSLVSGRTTSCGCRKRGVERENLIGNKYGFLTVIDFDSNSDHRHKEAYWVCECDCGNVVTVRGSSLKSGHTKSCGCNSYVREIDDLSGKRFGRLSVIEFDHMDKFHTSHWLCKCDCGNVVVVSRGNLIRGRAKSCGCYKRDVQRDLHIKHGEFQSRLHNIWGNMKQRCSNENHTNYNSYGERGISVCDEWLDDYEVFRDWALANGYSDDLTLDRRDNDGIYSPDNCRWADRYTQMNNRRNTKYITYNDETHSVAEWARILNVSRNILDYRLRKNDMSIFEDYFDSQCGGDSE